MFKRIFGFLALAFTLFGTQCWAQGTTRCFGPSPTTTAITVTSAVVVSCTNTFNSGTTTGIYDFSGTGDGILTLQFDTVLTMFDVTATVKHTINQLDQKEFPANTMCVKYAFNGDQCDQYDFTGSAGGPNGVPRQGIEYKFMITLTLEFLNLTTIHTPAFAHAPGDNISPPPIYTENFTANFSTPVTDPTINGKLPGISSVAVFDEPLSETDTFCWVSPATDGQTFTIGEEIEVSFRLFPSGPCTGNSGTPIRDKTAHLSLSTTDLTTGDTVFPPRLEKEEGNKFHWDHRNGVNEFDLSTEGLQPGTYTITVFSTKFSPQSRQINLAPSSGMVCLPLRMGVSCF